MEGLTPKQKRLRQERNLAIPIIVFGIESMFLGYKGVEKLAEMGRSMRELPSHPDGQFQVISVNPNETVVKQDGKEYTINTKDIPPDAKIKMIEANPQLKSFLENGPITIIDTNKGK